MKKSQIIIGTVAVAVVLLLILIPKIEHWHSVQQAEELLSHDLPPEGVPGELAKEVNLPVPFTSQAPLGNWDMPYQEACEEAAALMAIRYVFGNPILDAQDADAGIQDLVRTNGVKLGYPVDQTIEQLKDVIFDIDHRIRMHIVHDPTIEDLKKELQKGNVIILPAAGRELHNPFFQQPGPLYHMLVLRGFTKDGYFITNDPGTKRGEGYLYPFTLIMEAMGDWNDGDPAHGAKVVLMLEPFAPGEIE